MRNFAGIFRDMHFCMKQYIDFQKQSVVGALKMLAKCFKTVLDEICFIVNLIYQNSIKKNQDDLEH